MEKNCLQCNKVIKKLSTYSLKYWNENKRFCSKDCYSLSMKGKHNSPKSEFKKGRKQTEKQIKNMLIANTGINNYLYKGENVGYKCMHDWVTRWKGRPDKCEVCGNDKLKHRSYNWANIDHKYRRVLDDYIRMCVPCHKKYDYENHLSNIGSRGGSVKNKI